MERYTKLQHWVDTYLKDVSRYLEGGRPDLAQKLLGLIQATITEMEEEQNKK